MFLCRGRVEIHELRAVVQRAQHDEREHELREQSPDVEQLGQGNVLRFVGCQPAVVEIRGAAFGTGYFILPSTIVMADSVWRVGRSMILKEGNDIFVNNFEISRGEQSFP